MKQLPEMMTVYDVALLFQLSEKTIRRMIHDGRLEAVQVGRTWRIPKQAIYNFIELNRTSNEPPPGW